MPAQCQTLSIQSHRPSRMFHLQEATQFLSPRCQRSRLRHRLLQQSLQHIVVGIITEIRRVDIRILPIIVFPLALLRHLHRRLLVSHIQRHHPLLPDLGFLFPMARRSRLEDKLLRCRDPLGVLRQQHRGPIHAHNPILSSCSPSLVFLLLGICPLQLEHNSRYILHHRSWTFSRRHHLSLLQCPDYLDLRSVLRLLKLRNLRRQIARRVSSDSSVRGLHHQSKIPALRLINQPLLPLLPNLPRLENDQRHKEQ